MTTWRNWVFWSVSVLCIILAVFLVWWGWGYARTTADVAFHDQLVYNEARGKSPAAVWNEAVLYVVFRPFMIIGGLLCIPLVIVGGTSYLLEPKPPRPCGVRRYRLLSATKQMFCAFGGAFMLYVALAIIAWVLVGWQRDNWEFHPSTADVLTAFALYLGLVVVAGRLPLGDFYVVGGGILTAIWGTFFFLLAMVAREDPYWDGVGLVFGGIILLVGALAIGAVVFGRRLNRIIPWDERR